MNNVRGVNDGVGVLRPTGQRGCTNQSAAFTRRPPSVLAALRWESHKAGNLWYWLATALFDAIGMFNGWSQYMQYRGVFEKQDATWIAVWGQAVLLPSMVFMPLLVAAFAAQIEANEHRGRNWQRMAASGVSDAAFAGKMLHGLVVSALTVLVFEVEFVAVGMFCGFSLGQVWPFLARAVPMTLAVWAVVTLAQAVGAKAASFAGSMSVMLVLILGGCALSLIAPSPAKVYPMSLITSASAAMDLGNITSASSMVSASLVAALWVAIAGLLFRRFAKRAA